MSAQNIKISKLLLVRYSLVPVYYQYNIIFPEFPFTQSYTQKYSINVKINIVCHGCFIFNFLGFRPLFHFNNVLDSFATKNLFRIIPVT